MTKKTVVKRKNYYKPPRAGTPLTPMEKRVLQWCAKGYSKNESAPRLGMSVHGVDWHVRQILLKLRATNTTHAVFKACKAGVIK